MKKQHEPLRVPDTWRNQDRAFAIQLNRLLDDIYHKLETLETKIKEAEAEENE